MILFLLPVVATDENAHVSTRNLDFERKKETLYQRLSTAGALVGDIRDLLFKPLDLGAQGRVLLRQNNDQINQI